MDWSSLLSPKRINTSKKSTTKKSSLRSAFEKDFDRIIFSQPFRSLQDKTQVHPIPEHDFVHTRLTHSLEVSSVGRSLGKKAGETIAQRNKARLKFTASDFGAIVAAASLAHDLGNPPFGHSGERAISNFFTHHAEGLGFEKFLTPTQWSDMTHFEGNAQGFRILNKEQYQGLRLTYSTLGAFTKYPCSSPMQVPDSNKVSQKKYGFFQTEESFFNDLAKRLGLTKITDNSWGRHPLAFLVEAADDICYNIIDLEDGCRLGLVHLEEVIELLSDILKKKPEKLDAIPSRNEKVGWLRALTINQLIEECATVFLDNEDKILNNQFDQTLTSHIASKDTLKEITRISHKKIYRSRHVIEREVAGYTALSGLLEEFTYAGKCHLEKKLSGKQETLMELLPSEVFSEINAPNVSHYGMLRSVVDFISGMTDRYALSLYGKIKAHSI